MIEIRGTRPEDAPAVARVARQGFRDTPDMRVWEPEEVQRHVDVYPEGQFVAIHRPSGRVVGSATTMRVPREEALARHTWIRLTEDGTLATHDPRGDVMYGVDVCVHPRYRLGGVGKRLYEARAALLKSSDCVGFAAGGRLPNYHRFARYGVPVEEYIRLVEERVVRDPVLGFQLGAGMIVLDVLPRYLRDSRSNDWASLVFLPHPERPDARDVGLRYRRLPWDPPKPTSRATVRGRPEGITPEGQPGTPRS